MTTGSRARSTRGAPWSLALRRSRDGPVPEELPAGDRRADPTGAAVGEDLAGLALRTDPDLRRRELGPGGLRPGRGAVHAELPGAAGPPDGDGRRRHALRDGLDDARQHVGGGSVPRAHGTRQAGARGEVGDHAFGPRIHLGPLAPRDGGRRRAGRLEEPRRGSDARARLAAAACRSQALRVEEREVADWARVQPEEHARVLGGSGVPRPRGAVRGGAVQLPGGASSGAGALAHATYNVIVSPKRTVEPAPGVWLMTRSWGVPGM